MREQALAPELAAQPWRIREQLDELCAGGAQIGATLGAFIAESEQQPVPPLATKYQINIGLRTSGTRRDSGSAYCLGTNGPNIFI
jgi:hypothetical protein